MVNVPERKLGNLPRGKKGDKFLVIRTGERNKFIIQKLVRRRTVRNKKR